jgi:antitoxin HigA-1
MKKPPHPGLHLRYDYLEPLDLSVTDAAKALGVSRQALNNLVNGKSGISAEMAIRLSKAFGGGPDVWMRMQAAYDLAQAESRADEIAVRRVWRAPSRRRAAASAASAV